MPIITTDWVRRTPGQTSTLNLSGKYLLDARIEWRGVSELGARKTVTNSSTSGWYNTTVDIAGIATLPAVPSGGVCDGQTIGCGSEATTIHQSSRCFQLAWPGNSLSGCTQGSQSQAGSYTRYTTSWSRASCGSGVANFHIKATRTDGPYLIRARAFGLTHYKWTLRTQNPSVVVNGQSTSRSGTVTSVVSALLNGLQSNADNTLTHSCSAYNDVSGGSSGKLDFRIVYEYIEYPELQTLFASDIGPTSARLRGNLLSTGGAPCNLSFEYGLLAGGVYTDTISKGAGGIGEFDHILMELDINVSYMYRAYAVTSAYSSYHGSTWSLRTNGVQRDFATIPAEPTMATLTPIDITETTVTLKGRVVESGGMLPEVFFEYGKNPDYELGSISKGTMSLGEYTHDLTGLDYDEKYYYRAYGITDGTYRGNGQQVIFNTLYPYIPAPFDRSPVSNHETNNLNPVFVFTIGENTINPATKYHARVRFSKSVDIDGQSFYTMESRLSTEGWEAYIGGNWVAFPAEGIDPNTTVRVTPVNSLVYGPIYWDGAGFDGDRYGYNSPPRVLRIRINPERPYMLLINNNEWYVINTLKITETSNGEIGEIEFMLSNELNKNLLTENQSGVETNTDGFAVTNGTIEQSYEWAWEGDRGLKCIPTGAMVVTLDDVTVDAGEHTFSVYVHADPGQIVSVTITQGNSTTQTYSFSGTVDWERISVSKTLAEGTATVSVSSGNGTIYIDGFQFEKSPRATPWKLGGTEVYADEIQHGAEVVLSVRDRLDNVEEFVGRVRDIQPAGDLVTIKAILPDGFLGERICKTNYPTDAANKDITQFTAGDDGFVTRTETNQSDWLNSNSDENVLALESALTLQAVSDYWLYDEGTESVAWVTGHSAGAAGSQNKDATNLYIDATNAVYTGALKTWVTDALVSFADIHTLKVEWAVIPGPEITLGAARFGIGATKTDANFDVQRSRTSGLGRTIWTLDTSSMSGSYYVKLQCGHAESSNIAARWYRVWGEDEFGRVIAEYEPSGWRVSQPLDLSAVTNVHGNVINWTANVPAGTTLTISCGVNTSDTEEPATYTEAGNGDPIPGISAAEDMTGKFLWIKQELFANLTADLAPELRFLKVDLFDDGFFGVVVTSNSHGYTTGDLIQISGDNKYNGVWSVDVIDANEYGISTTFEADVGAVGIGRLVEDIGLYIQRMVNDHCMPITADDFVDTNTGYIAPISAKDSPVVRVLEQVRRNYGLSYFVDRYFRFHLYKPEDVIIPAAVFNVRRGESAYLRGD